jgi:hypothetical protein
MNKHEMLRRGFANYVVGASPKGVLADGAFRHAKQVHSHLMSLPKFKPGSVQVVGAEADLVAVVGLKDKPERDDVRDGAANAARALRKAGATGELVVEGLGDEEAALEGVSE